MAAHTATTLSPAVHGFAGAVPVPTPDLTAETIAMLAEVSAEIGENHEPAPLPSLVAPSLHRRHLNESQRAMAAAKLANMKSGHAASQRQPHGMIDENDGAGIQAPCISQREAADLLNVSRATVTEAKKVLNEGAAGDVRHGGAGDAAQAIHMRRALEGALDHGTALLAALGLPRLMEPGVVLLDPAAIGDAIHLAIATLDVLDAASVDLEDDGTAEPWLGWIDGKPVLSDSHDDREHDAADWDPRRARTASRLRPMDFGSERHRTPDSLGPIYVCDPLRGARIPGYWCGQHNGRRNLVAPPTACSASLSVMGCSGRGKDCNRKNECGLCRNRNLSTYSSSLP